ncbi:bladder cancer-related bc10 [Zalerion maritima]|uniref:Bladder cancer-related bc10 n=1 Tax=Zalerion maritima TaxID=339359 RepID=A0AAD5WTE9_9PEZI|nr:bladder cancer-related bc10 [Zalerion maritima]
MFCLRSWLPLLFIPTNASPAFILLFFICTYFLNRPCVYCSFLLIILFISSCYWSERCFFDLNSNWFQPRPPIPDYYSSPTESTLLQHAGDTSELDFNETALEMMNTTAGALASAAAEELARKRAEWTGLGIEWLRHLLGKREWRIEWLEPEEEEIDEDAWWRGLRELTKDRQREAL